MSKKSYFQRKEKHEGMCKACNSSSKCRLDLHAIKNRVGNAVFFGSGIAGAVIGVLIAEESRVGYALFSGIMGLAAGAIINEPISEYLVSKVKSLRQKECAMEI